MKALARFFFPVGNFITVVSSQMQFSRPQQSKKASSVPTIPNWLFFFFFGAKKKTGRFFIDSVFWRRRQGKNAKTKHLASCCFFLLDFLLLKVFLDIGRKRFLLISLEGKSMKISRCASFSSTLSRRPTDWRNWPSRPHPWSCVQPVWRSGIAPGSGISGRKGN